MTSTYRVVLKFSGKTPEFESTAVAASKEEAIASVKRFAAQCGFTSPKRAVATAVAS